MLPEIYPNWSIEVTSQNSKNIIFELYKKYTEKVHRKQQGHKNRIPTHLCVTKLICSLSPDQHGRYTGFIYVDWKTINQLDECQVLDDEVFHIQAINRDKNMDKFIQQYPNLLVWEISNSKKMKMMLHLDECFEELNAFINRYYYKNIDCLQWVHTTYK